MGIRKKMDDIVWSESKIQHKLRWHFMSLSTKHYEMFNSFVYEWESDYLMITKNGYAYECEIKISRSDFGADKKKTEKHLILESRQGCKSLDGEGPNYFYYAVPENLISPEEVPEYAGLVYCSERYGCRIVKVAPKLRKEKVDVEKLNLMDRFYWKYINYKDKYDKDNVAELKQRIKALEKQCAEYDDMLSEANNRADMLTQDILI